MKCQPIAAFWVHASMAFDVNSVPWSETIMLVQAAAKTWRRLKGANQLPRVIEGVTFIDGVATQAAENHAA